MFRNEYAENYFKNEFTVRFNKKINNLESYFINNRVYLIKKIEKYIYSIFEKFQKNSNFENIRYIAVNRLLTSLWIKEEGEYMFMGADNDFEFQDEDFIGVLKFNELYKFFIDFYYEEKNEIKKYIGKVNESDIKCFLSLNYDKFDRLFFSILYFALKKIIVPKNIEYIFYGDFGSDEGFEPVYFNGNTEEKTNVLVRNIYKNTYKKLFYKIYSGGSISALSFNYKIFYMMKFIYYTFKKISFEKSIFINEDFNNCSFKNSSFNGSIINGCEIKDCSLSYIDFSFINNKKIDYYDSFAYPTRFQNCIFNNVNFNNSDLSYMIFIDNEFNNVSFENAVMNNTVFSGKGTENLNLTDKQKKNIIHTYGSDLA